MIDAAIAGLIGFLGALIFIVVGLAKFAEGLDGTYSLSNVQIILWTGVILGSYLSLAVLKGGFLGDISPNLLALMGVSAGSLVAARGIRTVQERQFEVARARVEKNASGPIKKNSPMPLTGGLLSQEKDPNELSVAKLQLLAWTAVSVAIFIVIVAGNLMNNRPELPDIGSGLLVLMGVSNSAYVGNKIADKRLR